MLQAEQLLEDVQQAVNSVSASSSTANSSGLDTQQHKQRAPLVILCGDLNTTPDSATCQVHYPSLLPGCHCACCLANLCLHRNHYCFCWLLILNCANAANFLFGQDCNPNGCALGKKECTANLVLLDSPGRLSVHAAAQHG